MAGIGFELRRMIEKRRGFVARVRAYACAGLISSGPWLMTILTLTLLNLAGPYLGGTEGYSLFRALVTYAFAFSLILQGIAQMAVTRRIADLLYSKRYAEVLPAFAASLIVVAAVHAAIGTAFCIIAEFSPTLSFLAVSLFTIIGSTWIALIWLTVVRQYDDVLRAYIYGTLVAMVGVVLLFFGQGTTGVLAAYTAGQAFTLILLLRTILRGMDASGGRDYTILRSLGTFPMLVGVGFFYNAAIWVDKMIFWFKDGLAPHPLVRYHPLYDTCSFLAYLTVVPALAVNLVRLETAFYEKYRAYYGAILGGTPLGVIEDKRQRMLANLEENVTRLLRSQGAITVAVIVFAPSILEVLKLPPIATRLFRLTCLGAFFHVMLLINILMQMYFDLRKQAFATSLVFLLLNGCFAWWSVNRGVETYGIGYAMASFMSLMLGYLLLHRALERLDYMTFTSQPIGTAEERREAAALAEKERAQAEGAEEHEEEEETETVHRVAPAAVQIAAGEMAPPEVPAGAVEEELDLSEPEEDAEEEEIELEAATATEANAAALQDAVEAADELEPVELLEEDERESIQHETATEAATAAAFEGDEATTTGLDGPLERPAAAAETATETPRAREERETRKRVPLPRPPLPAGLERVKPEAEPTATDVQVDALEVVAEPAEETAAEISLERVKGKPVEETATEAPGPADILRAVEAAEDELLEEEEHTATDAAVPDWSVVHPRKGKPPPPDTDETEAD